MNSRQNKRQLKWDRRFLEMAECVSQWSKDPSTKVGAVIVDPETQRVISVGFNGFPRGIQDNAERLLLRETKYDLIIHAEMNALQFAERSVKGCTLYVYPLPPCIRCATMIIQSGIKRVVSSAAWPTKWGHWKNSIAKSVQLFNEAEVECSWQQISITRGG